MNLYADLERSKRAPLCKDLKLSCSLAACCRDL